MWAYNENKTRHKALTARNLRRLYLQKRLSRHARTIQKSRKWPNDYTIAIQPQNPVNVFDQDQKHYTWKMYTIQLYARRLND